MSSALPYGQKARELVQELGRSDWLPRYNEDGVRQVLQESNALHKRLLELGVEQGDDAMAPHVQCTLTLYDECVKRNKRCLLGYVKHRIGKVSELRWQSGSVIPPEYKSQLCPEEVQYFDKYDALLSTYMREADLDLCADMQPPKELYIEVRVLRDCGEILTENGPVNLERNTTHYLRRSDVEHLIRQGIVQQI